MDRSGTDGDDLYRISHESESETGGILATIIKYFINKLSNN